MEFGFRTAQEIIFGAGASVRAARIASAMGQRILLVTGAASLGRSGFQTRLQNELAAEGCSVTHWQVPREPDLALADEGANLCRQAGCDTVLAVGGGSALDAAKVVAALATNGGSALEYLEDVPGGPGRPVTVAPLPLICLPTTAGTGSEVTRNAVLKIPELGLKRSMRSDLMLPRVAIVDPLLLGSAPMAVAAAAGMDALTHLLEAYVSLKANPMTDAIALPGIRLAVRSLRAMAAGAVSPATWEEMALASLWGGIALANAGLGAVHGLVAPLGGLTEIPHGVGCACLLPETFRVNVAALEARQPQSPALTRFQEVAGLITETRGQASAMEAADQLEALRRELGIPPLRSAGLTPAAVEQVIAGSRGSSMRTNPITLTDSELRAILQVSLAS